MRGSKDTRVREEAFSAVRVAVHAYARDPSDTNAKQVRAALLRKRVLDERSTRQMTVRVSTTDAPARR